jgi:hypothetical protein
MLLLEATMPPAENLNDPAWLRFGIHKPNKIIHLSKTIGFV